MKKLLTVLSMILIAAMGTTNASASDKKTCNMLFIGNSFTMRHELPSLVAALAEEGNSDTSYQTKIVGYGGRNLFHHWEIFRSYNILKLNTLSSGDIDTQIKELKELSNTKPTPEFYTQFWSELKGDEFYSKFNKLRPKNWNKERNAIKQAVYRHMSWRKDASASAPTFNYVVLQSWLDMAAAPDKGYFKYATKFSKAANEINARTVLYLTASYAHNKAPVDKAVARERSVEECRLAQSFAKEINAIVVPVPLAITLAQESTEPVARTLTYRYNKDFHPNNTMAYLTACTFYAALFDKSPEGLKFNKVSENKVQNIHGEKVTANSKDAISQKVNPDGGPLDTIFTDEERIFLQRIAWKAVKAVRDGQY